MRKVPYRLGRILNVRRELRSWIESVLDEAQLLREEVWKALKPTRQFLRSIRREEKFGYKFFVADLRGYILAELDEDVGPVNAWALTILPRALAPVILTKGCLKLPDGQLLAILAHEEGHIQCRHGSLLNMKTERDLEEEIEADRYAAEKVGVSNVLSLLRRFKAVHKSDYELSRRIDALIAYRKSKQWGASQ